MALTMSTISVPYLDNYFWESSFSHKEPAPQNFKYFQVISHAQSLPLPWRLFPGDFQSLGGQWGSPNRPFSRCTLSAARPTHAHRHSTGYSCRSPQQPTLWGTWSACSWRRHTLPPGPMWWWCCKRKPTDKSDHHVPEGFVLSVQIPFLWRCCNKRQKTNTKH